MINVAGVLHNDLANGPNLRTVLFVQGCKHHCKGCHNQHTWPIGTGSDFTADELVAELTKNPMDKGITISGGEPILQWEELLPVIHQLKDKNYHLMLYTGYTRIWLHNKMVEDDLFLDFLSLFDMIVTEPYIDSLRITEKQPGIWYGSTNQKICRVDNNQLVII
jgi:anaerobic ribonucleoside-triphosphate reductase activating protein